MKNIHSVLAKTLIAALLIILIAIPMKSQISKLLYKMNNFLPDNLYIDQVPIGGKTLSEALDAADKLETQQLNKTVTIGFDDGNGYSQSTTLSYQSLGYYADRDSLQQQLDAYLKSDANLLLRILQYKQLERSRKDLRLTYSIHYDKFIKALESFDDSMLKRPVNAEYRCSNGKVEITKEEYGLIFDKEKLYQELLNNKDLTETTISVKTVMPAVTAKQLEDQGIKELVAAFTTKFDPGNAPRSSNIRLAAGFINNIILPPGATFSFNDTVGQRTEERGFKEAGVYINGKVDTGIGGGICQVSTTLYNAVLLADLKVLERSNHSLTVPYVSLSRDAAVNWGTQDFKFSNNTDRHLLIRSVAANSSITFELYGTKSNKKVELISTTLSRTQAPVLYIDDAAAETGREVVVDNGHDGFQSQLVKKVFVDGKLTSTEVISKDKYLTAARVIKRGIKTLSALEDPDI